MGKYQDEAKKLLELVGGKENIVSVTHCATRMRFALVDDKKANVKEIGQLPTVKGTFTNAGQFQVIMGNDVGDVYKDFISVSGISAASKEDVKKAAMKQQPFLQRMVAHLAEIFVPLIPTLVAGGLMLGIGNFLKAELPFLGVKEIVGNKVVYNKFQELYQWARVVLFFTEWIGGSVFGMLPVLICWSTTRKFKGNEALGIVLGLMLVAGAMLNAYDYGNISSSKELVNAGISYKDVILNGSSKYVNLFADGKIPFNIEAGKYVLDLGFSKLMLIGYQAQVLPAMFAGVLLCYVEKFFNKRTPEVLKLVWVPFITLIVTGFLTITIVGPFARMLGEMLVNIFGFLFKTPGLKYIGALLFGSLYAPLVITGLHHTFIAVDLQLAASGGTFIWPLIALSNIAQSGAVLATYFLYKKDEKQASVSLSSTVSAWFGITEPALFGANLKYMYPFYAAITASAVAAVISTGFDVYANGIGVGGLALAFLSIKFEGVHQLGFGLASLVAFGGALALTFVFSKTKLNKEK